MKKFGIEVSAYIEEEFEKKPTADEVIAYFQDHTETLLNNLDVDSVDEIG